MQATEITFTCKFDSPLGMIKIIAGDDSVLSIHFSVDEANTYMAADPVQQGNSIAQACMFQLEEYFNGTRKQFELPLDFRGTEFQKKVWTQLQQIPFGASVSYMQLAKSLGDPKCIRAAASANGKNPFAIVVPCHRVIGSSNDLVGYAGGLWRKRWLLQHESKQLQLLVQ